MKLSIIIVNYNVKYFLEQALLSAKKACAKLKTSSPSHFESEIIVVDNNSVDGSVSMLKEKFPNVQVIVNHENVGFSKANNQGIKKSSGEYVLLLNPDTVVEEDTFVKCITFMDQHTDAGGLGVKMMDGRGNFLPESKRGFPSPQVAFFKAFGFSSLFPKSKIFGKYHLGYLDKNEIHEVDVLAGAFMLLRKKVLDEIGLLDELFFMYGEDIDLSYRIKKAGYKNYYFPETRIIHYKGESTKKNSINYVFVFYNAMIIFARKHFSRQKARMFVFLIKLFIYIRAALSLFRRAAKKAILPLLDFGLMFFAMIYIKSYWETNIKFVEGAKYPTGLILTSITVATMLWMLGNYFALNYSKPYKPIKVIKGVFLGFLFISLIYAFLPESARSSRALIILGSIAAVFVFTFNRMLLHFLQYRNFNLGFAKEKKVLIIGQKNEANRVLKLLEKSNIDFNFIGFVTPEKENINKEDEQFLGNIQQIDEVVDIFGVNEIIFCSKNISSNQIIDWMTRISLKDVEFKIAPEESLFIIGSNSKNQPGDFYTIDIDLNIAKKENRINKRFLDAVISCFLLVTIPFNVWFVKQKGQYIKNLFQVFNGNLSLVGYAPNKRAYALPGLKNGILNPSDEARDASLDSGTLARLNFIYARDYTVFSDIRIILNGLRELGRKQ